MEAGVAGQHLPSGSGGRVAIEDNGNVFTESTEHEDIFPYPTELLNYWGAPSTKQDRCNDESGHSEGKEHLIE